MSPHLEIAFKVIIMNLKVNMIKCLFLNFIHFKELMNEAIIKLYCEKDRKTKTSEIAFAHLTVKYERSKIEFSSIGRYFSYFDCCDLKV